MMGASYYGLIERETIKVTIAHFTQDRFKKLHIPLPPISLQDEFARKVVVFKKLQESQVKTLEKLDLLFISLSNKYFNAVS